MKKTKKIKREKIKERRKGRKEKKKKMIKEENKLLDTHTTLNVIRMG